MYTGSIQGPMWQKEHKENEDRAYHPTTQVKEKRKYI